MRGNAWEKIHFDFVDYGYSAPQGLEGSNSLYLDVGSDLRVGVLDHHQFNIFKGSAARMVVRYPSYVRQAVDLSYRNELVLTVHKNPDLDSVASAAMALQVLQEDPDDAMFAMADYTDRVDSGRAGAQLSNPFSLYSAFAQLLSNISDQEKPEGISEEEEQKTRWREAMIKGIMLVNYVMEQYRKEDLPVEAVDAFACPRCLGRRDREYVQEDLKRYHASLNNPATKARIVQLSLPLLTGGCREVKGLFVRNVQSYNNPDRVMFFKDWARTDCERNPESGGFPFLSVIEEQVIGDYAQCWLSLRPDDGLALIELGQMLEEVERKTRHTLYGEDTRCLDQCTGAKKEPRKGFDQPDPWYDGRGHGYTIVAHPNAGTALKADEIEKLVITYGSGCDVGSLLDDILIQDATSNKAGKSSELEDSKGFREMLESQVILLDRSYQWADKQLGSVNSEKGLIFISYRRFRLDWVKEQLFKPLSECYGAEKVFLDLYNTEAGIYYVHRLGTAIQNAQAFIPVICTEYEQSPMCQWEYHVAQTAFLNGERPGLIHLLFEDVELPVYKSMHHAEKICYDGWLNRLLEKLASLLAG